METGAILEEAKRLALGAGAVIAAYVAGMTAISALVDIMGWNVGGDLGVNIANLAAGYLMLVAVVDRNGLAPDGRSNGFGTYFGLGILVGLGTAVGFVLLIIPGVILLVRWSAAYGYGLAGNHSVTDAMSESWQATKEHFFPILLAMLVPIGIMVVSLVIYALSFDEFGGVSAIGSIVGNLGIYTGSAVSTVVGLAIYSLLAMPERGLADVFE